MDIIDHALNQQHNTHVGIELELPRFNKAVVGMDRGDFWLITGQSSCYKSSFVLTQLILPAIRHVIRLQQQDPMGNHDIKVFYFLLEESERDLHRRILSHLFDHVLGQSVSENELENRQNKGLSAQQQQDILLLRPHLQKILSHLVVFDNITYGYGMYQQVREYLDTHGEIKYDPVVEKNIYVPHNPNEYVLWLVDHVGDMDPSEREKSLYEAIENLTKKYMLKLKNNFGVIPIIVQQQTNVGDVIATDYKGKTIESRLSPSTAELADNKTTHKRATQIISLFNPATYELSSYKGYTGLAQMAERWLYVHIHKNRRGPKNMGSGMWINPVNKHFSEYPPADDALGIQLFRRQHHISDGLLPPTPGRKSTSSDPLSDLFNPR